MKQAEKSEYKIYIDTSIKDNESVKLVKDVGSSEQIIGEIQGKIDIVSAIKKLLKKNKIPLKEVKFLPNLGPGSFTGLKVGVTISNILNYLNGKKTLKNLDLPNYGREPNISKPKSPKEV